MARGVQSPPLGVRAPSGGARWASGAVPGSCPSAVLPAKRCGDGVGAASSARRPVLGAAATGPSLPVWRGSRCRRRRAGDEPAQAEPAHRALEKSPACFAPSKAQAALSN